MAKTCRTNNMHKDCGVGGLPLLRFLYLLFSFAFILISTNMFSLAGAKPVQATHSSVELIAENPGVQAGKAVSLGIRLKPEKNWHTYWTNPGDAGKSIEVVWDNPKGVIIGPMQFPAPQRVPFMGMVSYGYDDDILVVFNAQIPKSYEIGTEVYLRGAANWLACDDELCVPQNADVSLNFRVGETENGQALSREFDIARAKIPVRVDWPTAYSAYGERGVLFHVEVPDELTGIDRINLFTTAQKTIDHATLKQVETGENGIAFLAQIKPWFNRIPQGDVVLTMTTNTGERQAYVMAANIGDLSHLTVVDTPPARGEARPVETASKGSLAKLLAAIGFAIFGGLLLNLMPCVLPILSLKALSLVKLSGEDLKTARTNGLVYTAGILASFLLFALVLVALRSAGSYAGWGFQMQHPAVLVILILLIGAIGANLAGLFEFGTKFANVGQGITQSSGYKAEFFTGVLAVVVASPCTTPFMGGALGYALTQPLLTTILVFLGLGLGLALPYLLLCYFPAARSWIPKPGAWMHSFKQLLAFPMFATAIWLLWVLGHQVGLQYVLGVLVLALLLAMAVWANGKARRSPKKIAWNLFALVILAGAVWTVFSLPALKETKQVSTKKNVLSAQTYSLAKLESLLADNQSVFVYFTADWCITCKVNEKAALYKPEVAAAFAEKNVRVLVGDWTNPDDEIAKILKRFDRIGVPLYLYYAPGTALDDAKILPQLLTTKTILGAL